MGTYVSPPGPPSRILNALQQCVEADPDFYRAQRIYWIYEMANRRRFNAPNPLYSPPTLTTDSGQTLTTDSGETLEPFF